MLDCWQVEQDAQHHQMVRSGTSAPGEQPQVFRLSPDLSHEALAQLAHMPEYATGLVQVYVPQTGWQSLPHRPHPQFQGFELLGLRFSEETDRLDDFEATLARDGQYVGTIRHDLEGQVLQFQLCTEDREAFLTLAAYLDFPEDPIKGLFYALAECLHFDAQVLTAQYVRTTPQGELPSRIEPLPLTWTPQDLARYAKRPDVQSGLQDYYVRHQGWQPLPHLP